jgi:hypothetical protein
LVADAQLGTEVTQALLAWTTEQRLESIACFGLLVLFRAKAAGATIPSWEAVAPSISKPSLLSWLIVSNLYGKSAGELEIGTLHSGSPPEGFQVAAYFGKYAKSLVPPIYLDRAERIDRRNCPGFLRQWEFEWTRLVELTGFPLNNPYVSFWMRQDDDHLVCVDLPLSEVYRSAFLRALAWAAESGEIGLRESFWLAAQTCPIDLGLWVVPPSRAPDIWPKNPPTNESLETVPGWVAGELMKMWERQANEEWLIAKADGRVHEIGDSAYDLEITGIIQSCVGLNVPDVTDLSDVGRRAVAWQEDDLLTFAGNCRRESANSWQEEHADWLVWPVAGAAHPNTVPRWQWWRWLRGAWLPAAFLTEGTLRFRPAETGVRVDAEEEGEVARWNDWTHQLRETSTANLSPSTGQMLLIRRSIMERAAEKLGGVFAWICKITTYQRAYGHGPFKETHFTIEIGSTRIVRDRR